MCYFPCPAACCAFLACFSCKAFASLQSLAGYISSVSTTALVCNPFTFDSGLCAQQRGLPLLAGRSRKPILLLGRHSLACRPLCGTLAINLSLVSTCHCLPAQELPQTYFTRVCYNGSTRPPGTPRRAPCSAIGGLFLESRLVQCGLCKDEEAVCIALVQVAPSHISSQRLRPPCIAWPLRLARPT